MVSSEEESMHRDASTLRKGGKMISIQENESAKEPEKGAKKTLERLIDIEDSEDGTVTKEVVQLLATPLPRSVAIRLEGLIPTTR